MPGAEDGWDGRNRDAERPHQALDKSGRKDSEPSAPMWPATRRPEAGAIMPKPIPTICQRWPRAVVVARPVGAHVVS